MGGGQKKAWCPLVSGAPDPEIAQALFLTIKTVEMHLTHAYRKLDIQTRRELAVALAG